MNDELLTQLEETLGALEGKHGDGWINITMRERRLFARLLRAEIDRLDQPCGGDGVVDQGAIDALKDGQRQIDADGSEVGVSRQALDELIAGYEVLRALAKVPVAWQRRWKYPANPGAVPSWEPASKKEATDHFERKAGYEYRALYDAPQPKRAIDREAAKEALRRWHRDSCYPDALDGELEIGLDAILSLALPAVAENGNRFRDLASRALAYLPSTLGIARDIRSSLSAPPAKGSDHG